jgi:hypothetical protein
VRKVIAINPYDYGRGTGLARADAVAGLIFAIARVPVLGEMVMRLRNVALENRILQGGVADPKALTPGFYALTYASGYGPVTITPSSISFAMPITGTRRGNATARSTFRCSWSMASRTGRTLKSGNARSSRFLERGLRWCLTADILSLDQPKRPAEIVERFA